MKLFKNIEEKRGFQKYQYLALYKINQGTERSILKLLFMSKDWHKNIFN